MRVRLVKGDDVPIASDALNTVVAAAAAKEAEAAVSDKKSTLRPARIVSMLRRSRLKHVLCRNDSTVGTTVL